MKILVAGGAGFISYYVVNGSLQYYPDARYTDNLDAYITWYRKYAV